jgi:hypothetical protein
MANTVQEKSNRVHCYAKCQRRVARDKNDCNRRYDRK